MEIRDKIKIADNIMPGLVKSLEACDLCPRKCGANRMRGEEGFCLSGPRAVVFTTDAHHGEEPPISGENGSGTIFFSCCNMRCCYCQNHNFSQVSRGRTVTAKELSQIMIKLQNAGAHNINLVSPTHFVPQIAEALRLAWLEGLKVPIVYNTGGYDSLSVVRRLEGLIDIYLPDMRYASDSEAEKYSEAPGYVKNNRQIVIEMQRQVGRLKTSKGIALSGLIVRLLILPGGISRTEETLEFIANELGKDVAISVMSQYYPAYKASSFKELSKRISRDDYEPVVKKVEQLGFSGGWLQPFESGFDKKFSGETFKQNL